MRKIFRSLCWMQATESQQLTENLKIFEENRLLNLTTAQRAILKEVMDFYVLYQEAPQFQVLLDIFEKAGKTEEVTLLEEVAQDQPYLGSSFKALFEEEIEVQAAALFHRVCRTAVKIASQGDVINKVQVKGVDEAIAYLYSEVKETPKPEAGRMSSNMRKNEQSLTDLYEKRKNSPAEAYGIMTGYGLFDQSFGGIKKKHFYLHAGFGGHLKSTHMFNMIVNAAVNGGWNMELFTSEMPAEDVKQIMIAIHSGNKIFQPAPTILATALLKGMLDPKAEKFYQDAKHDLLTNPAYGSIRVCDSSEFSTFGSIQQRATRDHAEEEIDGIWVDYLTRLPVDAKYRGMDITSARNETIADAKRFAMSFAKGRGVALGSPFQVNREGYKRARDNEGRMDKTALAQYNAAEKEADEISYIFYDEEESKINEPKVGILKSRWGKQPSVPVPIYIDPDNRRMVDLTAGMAIAGAAPTLSQDQEEVVI